MNHRLLKPRFLSLLLIIATFSVHTRHANALSLIEAYQQALTYDAEIEVAKANNLGAQQELPKAIAGFLPKIQLGASKGRGRTESEFLSSGVTQNRAYDTQSYNLTLKQPLFNKRVYSEYQQSKAKLLKSEANLAKETQSLMSRLTEAYLNVLMSQDSTRYAQAKKNAAEEALTQAKRKYENGVGTIVDYNDIQATNALLGAQLQEQISHDQINRHEFEVIVGQYPQTLNRLIPEQMNLNLLQATTEQDWITTAIAHSPIIETAKQQLEIITKQTQIERSGHYPTLDFVASRSYSESDNNITIGQVFDTRSYSLQLNVPIYAGGYVNAATSQAIYGMQEAEAQLKLQERKLAADIRSFYAGVTNAIESINAYQQAEKATEIALQAAKRGQQNGQKTVVDVLNAQYKLIESQTNLAKARYQFIGNYVKLKENAGILTQEDIQTINLWFAPVSAIKQTSTDPAL